MYILTYTGCLHRGALRRGVTGDIAQFFAERVRTNSYFIFILHSRHFILLAIENNHFYLYKDRVINVKIYVKQHLEHDLIRWLSIQWVRRGCRVRCKEGASTFKSVRKTGRFAPVKLLSNAAASKFWLKYSLGEICLWLWLGFASFTAPCRWQPEEEIYKKKQES